MFSDSSGKMKIFWTYWQQVLPIFSMLLVSLCKQFWFIAGISSFSHLQLLIIFMLWFYALFFDEMWKRLSFPQHLLQDRPPYLWLIRIVVFLIVFMSSLNQLHSVYPNVICHFHSLLVFLGGALNWTNYIWLKKVEAICIKIFWENRTPTFPKICKLCCDSTLLHMNTQQDMLIGNSVTLPIHSIIK